MDASQTRIALFSGNYNYVRDGANRALNTLVGYLLRQGCAVRVYSPTTRNPAFEPTGDLVSLPSIPVPGRTEYHFATGIDAAARRDLEAFAPDIVHISSPDAGAHAAVRWARARGLPVLASVHTRFDTYFSYYNIGPLNLGFIDPIMFGVLKRLYRRCDALLAPSESFVQLLREQGMNQDIGVWSRGIDSEQFNPAMRDMNWRRARGIEDDAFVVGYLGRLVLEKGLDVFTETIARLNRRRLKHRIVLVGEGPARPWLEPRLPGAVFTGHQTGADLGHAVAAMDVLLNPSLTEAFGNVMLEAMACAVPVVAAHATGSSNLVEHDRTGFLCAPGNAEEFADRIGAYMADPGLRVRHGAAGVEKASRYRWDPINQSVLDTYRRLIAARKG